MAKDPEYRAVTMASRILPNVDYSKVKPGDLLTLTRHGLPMGTKASGTLVIVMKVTKHTILCSNGIKVPTKNSSLGLADPKHGTAGYRIS